MVAGKSDMLYQAGSRQHSTKNAAIDADILVAFGEVVHGGCLKAKIIIDRGILQILSVFSDKAGIFRSIST
jgi:hypothetical protein